MAAYRWVYDSRHLQADCQELGSAPEPYARYSSMGYLFPPVKKELALKWDGIRSRKQTALSRELRSDRLCYHLCQPFDLVQCTDFQSPASYNHGQYTSKVSRLVSSNVTVETDTNDLITCPLMQLVMIRPISC